MLNVTGRRVHSKRGMLSVEAKPTESYSCGKPWLMVARHKARFLCLGGASLRHTVGKPEISQSGTSCILKLIRRFPREVFAC